MCGTNCIMTSGPEKKISMHLKHNSSIRVSGYEKELTLRSEEFISGVHTIQSACCFYSCCTFAPLEIYHAWVIYMHVYIYSQYYMKFFFSSVVSIYKVVFDKYAHHAYSVCLLYANLVIIKISFNCCLWDLDTMLLNLINKPCHRHFVDFENKLCCQYMYHCTGILPWYAILYMYM